MICAAKHTPYQPNIDDGSWHCPKCGCGLDEEGGEFVLTTSDDEAPGDCEQLHEDDECYCSACGWDGSGKQAAALLAKEAKLKTCPTCQGRGVVER